MTRYLKTFYAVLLITAVGLIVLGVNRQRIGGLQRLYTHQAAKQEGLLTPIGRLQNLSGEVQAKIWNQQNPKNCDAARLLVYDIHSWYSGFASTTHVCLMHFFLAFYDNRTFVLNSKGWAYDEKGWDHYFLPLGKCKYSGPMESLPELSDKTADVRIVRSVSRNPYDAYNWKVPKNILDNLKNVHNDPYAWWVGQFVQYQLRFQPWFMEILANRSENVPVTNSTVGLQVRWGDKIGGEAIKHPVSEYMNFAKEWFERPEHRSLNKTVYVATEQSEAWKDLEDNYHEFTILGSGYVTGEKQMNIKNNDRYAERKNELDVVLTDIHFLSKCPYVVCTFSSNLCRLLYEMKASHSTNPQTAITSLDDTFYWVRGTPRYRVMDESHEGSMDLKIGDIFVPAREAFTPRKFGYILGRNDRTGQIGRVPEHVLQVIVEPLNFDL